MMLVKGSVFCGFLILALSSAFCGAQEARTDVSAAAEISGDDTNCTVITSDRLSYDAEKKTAVFDGNVEVRDPQMNLNAEALTILFSEDHQMESIQARGQVKISQKDIIGEGDEAVYYMREGKVVLTGKPRIRRKNDELSGEIITFYRETGRMICEPNAVLKLRAMPEMSNDLLQTKEEK
jgi:lipopolysaccharide transport protein LptA